MDWFTVENSVTIATAEHQTDWLRFNPSWNARCRRKAPSTTKILKHSLEDISSFLFLERERGLEIKDLEMCFHLSRKSEFRRGGSVYRNA